MNFGYIHQVCDGQVYTEKLQKTVSAKAKYVRSLGIARKALDLAQKLNCYNELNGILQTAMDKENIKDNHQENGEPNIICSNPVTSRVHGRPPNRYLSEGETANQNKKRKVTNLELEHTTENEVNGGDDKKQRRCNGCKGIGHDLRNC
ncbi:7014_t:CDS:2 [Funneliformis geosporum]|uniref:5049_t:CDS:1 n=1 Tax=Funneliformis geosporum TaxID=1117311 RepID=A0A9W4SXI8_9GLOM|nr:5049_t:CDS:2 [Funneliformis geosporum]CAI2185462.1 7014_t:CDS:2 [Funneliformis geosporum]